MNNLKLINLIISCFFVAFMTACEVEEDDDPINTGFTSSTALSTLTVNGSPIAGFDPEVLSYTYAAKPALGVPEVKYTLRSSTSTAQQLNASSIPGKTRITVKSSNGSAESIYEINFTVNNEPVEGDTTVILSNFSNLSFDQFQYFTSVVCNCQFQNGNNTSINPVGGSPIRISLIRSTTDLNQYDELWLEMKVIENTSDTKYVFIDRNFDESNSSTFIAFTQSFNQNLFNKWSSIETVEVRVNQTAFSTSTLYGIKFK